MFAPSFALPTYQVKIAIIMFFTKQTIPIAGFFTICFLYTTDLLIADILNNTRCPVEPTEIAVAKYKSTYKGKTIYFCCKDCVTTFNDQPEPYLENINDSFTSKSSQNNKSAIQKIFDSTWNTGFSYPGISILMIGTLGVLSLRFASLLSHRSSTPNKYILRLSSLRSFQVLLVFSLVLEILHAHISHSIASKDRVLENDLHSTTFLEYGEPLIPSHPKTDPSLQSKFYRGNDERNPNLYNGGNYRTAEFDIGLCDNGGNPINYNSQVAADNLFLKVTISRAPNTAEYFWKKERMNEIYVTKNSGKFHWTRDKITDYVQLIETDKEKSWEFRYPLEEFHKGNHIKGILYLCEKRKSTNGSLLGGRFHYAFQFNLKINDDNLDAESDVWMGPLYRKRSLRIWEIPEHEWLTHKPIPENQSKTTIKDTTLLGIKDYKENTN